MRMVQVLDTTLRDGTQGEGISLSVADKLRIASKLDELGIGYIEGGFPGANPKDQAFFAATRKQLRLRHAKLAAFGSTRRSGSRAEDDEGLRTLALCGAPVVTIVGKAWDFHVHEALQVDLDENLAMIFDSVHWLKAQGLEVIFDAEHFFDGFAHNPAYALSTVLAAADAGVDWVTLCDTNGGSLPDHISSTIERVHKETSVPVGVHAHNDCELAVANTLAAVASGATMVHGTINGIGERCGNANLASIIPNLELKMNVRCLPTSNHIAKLTDTSRFVGEIANLAPNRYQPFVGHSAFAHKGGIHVSAIAKNPHTYEHVPPSSVGNERRVLVSELSGASNVQDRARAFGFDLADGSFEVRQLLNEIKDLEYQGYQFESAEASQELLFMRAFGGYRPLFEVLSMRVEATKGQDGEVDAQAVVRLTFDGEEVHMVAAGNGPVNALDVALRKAVRPFYPEIDTMHLSDYKVRVLDEKAGTSAKVRVLIESTNGHDIWQTIGVSHNVIEASWEALVDGVHYFLLKICSVDASARNTPSIKAINARAATDR